MDSSRFDQLVKSFGMPSSRRSVLGILAALGLVGAAAIAEDASAKKQKKKRRKKRKKKDRQQRQGKADQEQCIALDQRCRKHGVPCCDGAKCRTLLGLPLLSGRCRCPQETRECAGACIALDACCEADGTGSCPPCDVCASGCPHSTVQAAIDAAGNGDTLTICAGAYSETIAIDKDLTLSGAGDGADPASNTVLDGAGAGTVVTIAAGAVVTLKTLRVTGGNGEFGGGISIEGGTLDIDGCTVSGNTANDDGGGIYHVAGTLTLSNSTVSGNTTSSYGGGIHHEDGTLHLANSTVSGNTAVGGGGLSIDGSTMVTLTNCTVSDNTASVEGGGIHTDDDVVTLTLTNCTVSGNTSGTSGGGIFGLGNLTLINTIVRDNRAIVDPGFGLHGDGGGIVNAALGTLTLEGSTVTNNHATFEGGGIANWGTVSCSAGSTVSGNTAGTAGAENCFDDPAFGGSGCATCPA